MSGKKPKKHDILPLLVIKKILLLRFKLSFLKKVATEHL